MLIPRLKPDDRSGLALSARQIEIVEQIKLKLLSNQYHLIKRQCPLCGHCSEELVAEKERYGLPLTTALCRICGLLYTNPVMRKTDYEHFYKYFYRELYSENVNGTQEFFDSQKRHGTIIYNLLKEKYLKPKSLIVEVGSGCGGILAAFKHNGHQTIGYDFNEAYLAFGRGHSIDLRPGTMTDHPENQPADIIIYSHVIEHILDIDFELEAIFHRLKNDGFLYVECPGLLSIPKNYLNDLNLYLQSAHLMHFNLNLLVGIFAKNGFELVEGNEKIQAVFKKSKKNPVIPSEYLIVKKLILECEKKHNSHFGLLKKFLVLNALFISKKIGIYSWAKRSLQETKVLETVPLNCAFKGI